MIETLKGFLTDAVAVRAGGFVTDAKRERILLTLGSWTASGQIRTATPGPSWRFCRPGERLETSTH